MTEPNYSNQADTLTFYVSACSWQVLNSPHVGAMQVALGDGSVRGVSQGISATTWVYACTPNDGQPLGPDW